MPVATAVKQKAKGGKKGRKVGRHKRKPSNQRRKERELRRIQRLAASGKHVTSKERRFALRHGLTGV